MINFSLDRLLRPHSVPFLQAAEKAEKLREQRKAEDRESLAHMFHTMTSDLMTECVEAADIQVGGGRPPQVLVNQWKGMNTEQLNTIHKQRDQQLLEKQVLQSVVSVHIFKIVNSQTTIFLRYSQRKIRR